VVFDSFDGIPEHDEPHDRNIFGGAASFPKGSYRGTLEEVKANVARYGQIGVCSFVQGWFEETMLSFSRPIAAVYLDVDLAASTRTCLKYLYPLLVPGGALYSQDGHLPLVIDVFNSNSFWQREVGFARPHVEGLGIRKLIWATKPDHSREQVAGQAQTL
jgi:O-methyltransferase